MLQPLVTSFVLLLVAATHVACLVAAWRLFIVPVPQFPDWQVLRPARTHWFSLFGCWGFSAIVTWVWLFVDTDRFDAGQHKFTALLLILGFGAGAVRSAICIAKLRRAAIRWRADEICWQSKGRDVCQKITDFKGVSEAWDGVINIHFRDGTILKLDQYALSAISVFEALWRSMDEDSFIENWSSPYSRFPVVARVHGASRIAGFSAIFAIGIMLIHNQSNPIYITAEYPEILKIMGVTRYMSLGEMWAMGIAFMVLVVACFCGVTTAYYMENAEN